MPRIIQTTPSGSPPPNYLSQSKIGLPVQTGVVRETPSGLVYGYSGTVSFDVSASATYPMMDFQLEFDALFRGHCYFDYNALGARTCGISIAIDGTTMIRSVNINDANSVTNLDGLPVTFYVPSNKRVEILLLNPESASSLVQANISLIGEKI